MSNTEKGGCPDCGNAQVNHSLRKLDSVFSSFFDPLNTFTDEVFGLANFLTPKIVQGIGPFLFRNLPRLGIGKIISAPDEKTGGRARCVWNEAQKRGIEMQELRLFGISGEIFLASYKNETIVFASLPRPKGHISRSISWIDNKGIMREKFSAHGLPVARGKKCFSFKKAKRVFAELEKPVIVKPTTGSRSRHTTTHIVTDSDFEIAFKKAKQLSISVIIEEELQGMVYRGTVIGGKLEGVLRREPPCVFGDGIHTLEELIEIENKRPERQGPIFHPIEIGDPEQNSELIRQKITLKDKPSKGIAILLGQKASRGIGGGATDVTDITHPENKQLLEEVARVLDESVVGIDFIIPDISLSWKEQKRAGIIECNGMPFIDLHMFPLIGKVRDTPKALWDIVFPASKK